MFFSKSVSAVFLVSAFLFFFGSASFAVADSAEEMTTSGNGNSISDGADLKSMFGPSFITSLEELLLKVITLLGTLIVLASVVGIVVGGAFLVFSGGDDGKVSRGKDIIVYSLIGLAVTLCSYLIVTLVQAVLYDVGET